MSLPDAASPGTETASRDRLSRAGVLARLAVVGLLAGGLAGCFQPLYADNATVGGPALEQKLGDVEVMEVRSRLGDDLRNELIFMLTGGQGNPKGAPFQLYMAVDTTASTALVNSSSGLPESQIIRVSANWRMIKSDDEKKRPIAGGSAVATASIDVSSQRFANYSATRDAEARAARLVAEQIKGQLIGYFLQGSNALPPPGATKGPAAPGS